MLPSSLVLVSLFLLVPWVYVKSAKISESNVPFNNLVTLNQLPLRTSGRWIVDRQGKRVKLVCVNWHGGHLNTFAPAGLHFQTSRFIAGQLKRLGFNCVRLNWSLELFYSNPKISRVALKAMYKNGVFTQDVRALEVLDRVVGDLAAEQVMVILDNHMSDAGWCCSPWDKNGVWDNEKYSAEMFGTAWESMAARYAQQPFVIGTDLRNEIRPDIRMSSRWVRGGPVPKLTFKIPTWGTGDRHTTIGEFAPYILNYTHPEIDKDPRLSDVLIWLKSLLIRSPAELYDWHAAATSVGNRIQAANPNVLIIIPGIFDLNSYVPNIMHLVFFGLKTDSKLRNTVGRFFNIPDAITQYQQIHNLSGIRQLPVRLNEPKRLVYSAHLYPFYYDGSQFKWNGTDPSYAEYSRLLDKFWGYIFQDNIAPLWIGETGNGASAEGLSSAWLNYTVRYLAQHDLDFAYWPIGDSRPTIDLFGRFLPGADEYALLNRTFNGLKYAPMYESFRTLIRPQRGPGVHRVSQMTDPPQYQLIMQTNKE